LIDIGDKLKVVEQTLYREGYKAADRALDEIEASFTVPEHSRKIKELRKEISEEGILKAMATAKEAFSQKKYELSIHSLWEIEDLAKKANLRMLGRYHAFADEVYGAAVASDKELVENARKSGDNGLLQYALIMQEVHERRIRGSVADEGLVGKIKESEPHIQGND